MSILIGIGKNLRITPSASPVTPATPFDIAYAVLNASNPAGWYRGKDLTRITKDGSNLISQINDLLGVNDLVAAPYQPPLWVAPNIIKFDGVNDGLNKEFVFNQPFSYYFVCKQITRTTNDVLVGGGVFPVAQTVLQSTIDGRIGFSGTSSLNNDNAPLNTWLIVRAKVNGASSSLQVNETPIVNGTSSAINPHGLFVGFRGGWGDAYADVEFKEIIAIHGILSASDDQAVYDYLAWEHSI